MAQTSDTPLGDGPDRVWSLAQLEVLQEVAKPIIVVVTTIHDDPSGSALAVHCKSTSLLVIVTLSLLVLQSWRGQGNN